MDRLNFFTKKFMKKINKDNFKKTLSAFATGITVVATKYNSILYGKTINSFSSLSLSPPLVLFSLDNKSSKLNIFKKCETITINILSNKQQLVSNNFAKKTPDWHDIDYYSLMVGENRGLKKEYTTDGVHLNKKGYEVMSKLVQDVLKKEGLAV